ncbi:CPBP family glutamic-type intramembrane protease [Sphingomonas sp. LY29]|uniref:CPBP family glutamic-type intramembrane protease n=1 Tax=Sphingomonas sp. LY29 TaxID=3095341 RepID=UPI002D768CF7|nr:CPBP family glutamic-type intramembrane protease [Sphingomonas sp. LY29]WRP26937.1 CPBP family glutamic-type intramembrane protease [Sphingomonas sp. LY29]
MTEQPTSRTPVRPSPLAIYRDFAAFVRRPRLPERTEPFDGHSLGAVGWLLLLNIAIALPLAVLLTHLAESASVDTPQFEALTENGPLFTLALGALGIPLVEEIFFRGWINGRRTSLVVIAIAVVAVVLVGVLLGLQAPAWTRMAAIGAALAAILVAWWRGRHHGQAPQWFARIFPLVYFGQAIAFGLVHLTNYKQPPSALLLLFVVPQLVAGLINGYARVRFGMWGNVTIHALSNGLFLSMMLSGL